MSVSTGRRYNHELVYITSENNKLYYMRTLKWEYTGVRKTKVRIFREFLCLHNPLSYNNTCNDEGGNICPEGGCDRAKMEVTMAEDKKEDTKELSLKERLRLKAKAAKEAADKMVKEMWGGKQKN